MRIFYEIFFFKITLRFVKNKKNISFKNLNFKLIDFSNYKQIKNFIFKKEFYKLKNKYVQSFEFLNFSQNLGGKIGINLSKNTIFEWSFINKYKIGYPWSSDLASRRLINLIYNYEFINSSSNNSETKKLDRIIMIHIYRVIYQFNKKNISGITSSDILANSLSCFILQKDIKKQIKYLDMIINYQIDSLGMHKSYNILEHSKFLNNIKELKSIFLYFKYETNKSIENVIIKMTSVLNEYFHSDGSIPLFNGSNNNYTKLIYNSLNKDIFLKSRKFKNTKNGIAFYSDKNKTIFFDVVQPNKDLISNSLSAGTLSFEFSSFGEKIITNCGASESFGKNPEYLRYSAAHSTIILQNTNISEIKEDNPHIKYPQSVTFNTENQNRNLIFEGSHNGYMKKFAKIIKRKILIDNNNNSIFGEDSIISLRKEIGDRIIFHIRFHLVNGISYIFTNNKKNIILKTKLKNMWLFKSETELIVEDSIIVDNNNTLPTKQIVIKGIITKNKQVKKWSLEKI